MKKIYTLLLTLISVIASAQYNFTVYNTSNSGIVSNTINDIKVDSNGSLWIATPAGVSTYNGTAFTNYTTGNSGIASNAVTEIEIDGLGRKWMATQNNGIVMFNGTTWTNYTTSNSDLPGNAIRNIAVDSANNLWVTTIGALLKFNGTTWTTYDALPNINSLEIDGSNGVWVTNNGVLYKFNGTDFTFIGQNAEKLLDTSAGTIYVDGNGGEMYTYATSGTLLSTYDQSNSCLAGSQPNALDVDSDGAAWIAFNGSGLQNFSDCATYTTTNSGLPSNTLNAIRTQNSGTVWLGHLSLGLIKSTPQNATGCWQEISAGFEYSVGIKADGTLWAWGRDSDSQLGDGAVVARNAAVQIGTATNWKTVSAGGNHTLAIKTDGTLWAWGNNSDSQLGDNTTTARLTPIQIGTATNWKSISAGHSHSLAIRTDGSLYGWGDNTDGQLGDGSTVQRSTPFRIGTATNWVKIAAGNAHSVGIKADGTLWTWGNNTRGELGNGTNTATIYDVSPRQVGTATNWLKIAAGSFHTLAIKSNGTLWGWAYNEYGQLGNGTTTNSYAPVQIGTASNWSSIDAASTHSLGIKTNGTLWSWGANSEGQLGNGTSGVTNTTAPVQVGTTTNSMLVAAGQYHSLEVNFSGSLSASGYNSNGQLGDNTNTQKNSFTAVVCPSNCSTPTQPSASNVTASTATLSWTAATPAPASGYMYAYSTNPIIGGNNGTTLSTTINLTNLSPGTTYYYWVASHCGFSQSNWIGGGTFTTPAAAGCWTAVSGGSDYVVATKADGTTWAWGNNEFGQLGDGTTNNKAVPTQIAITNVWKMAAGANHALAIKLDGTLWAWGSNQFGQLGNGTTTNRTAPVRIGTATDWQSIAVGDYFTLAVKANGTLWAWGHNTYGQFGNGSTSDSTTPIQIGTLTTWKSVAAGGYHSLAIRTDGTLWGWGQNYSGQVGDQSTTNRTTPVQVAFGTTWKTIDAGGTHSLGIKTDNTLWAWGTNFSGELGTGGGSRTYPGQVGTATNWRSAEIGDFHSAGIKSDGTLWTWGANSDGELGDGTLVNRNVPTLIGTATDRQSIAVGRKNTHIISTNGNLFGAGDNSAGQIGDGTLVDRNTLTFVSCTAVAALSASSSQTNVSCFAGSNGTATVNPSGGVSPYSYVWSPAGGTGATAIGLTSGSYTCTITDSASTQISKNFTITQPTALVTTAASQTNISCFGGSNGAAAVNAATGGAGGYTYNWTPGTPTGDGTTSVSGLTAGTWICTVTDANSCTASQSFTVTQPTTISMTAASQTNISCNGGSNGAAAVNAATGGVGGYTYNWTPGNPSGDGTTSVSGLTAGTWTCTVTDANSCTASQSFTVTQPTAISMTPASQTNISCNGGSNGAAAVNTATGGAGGYTYNWTPGNPSGDGTTSVTGLTAGTWTCTVTDANSCTASQSFTVTQPTAISMTPASQTNISCNGGSNGAAAVNTATGGAGGYTYNWTPGNPTGDGTASVSGLTAGTWTCTVTDTNSCTASQSFTVTQPTAIDNTIAEVTTGTLTANEVGATFQWYECPNTLLTGETNQNFTPTSPGDYKVKITFGACTVESACYTVSTLDTPAFVKTQFMIYPNPTSGLLYINTNFDGEFLIVNQLGQTIKTFKVSANLENNINVENFADGIYYIKGTNGTKISCQKLIIKK